MVRLFHTPEGVRDVYNGECEQKMVLEDKVHQVFHSFGYRDIETPTFEFFDVFSREVGTIPSKDLYKFFDRDGNTLVLRPDFTPSIARATAMYFLEEDKPIRLCYKGSTFINNSSYQGRLKESTQMGVELIGDASVESDAEIVALMIQTLLKCGLKDFQVSIGQVDFFKSLLEEAQMDEEIQERLRSLISTKYYFGVQELIETLNLSKELENAFLELPRLFGPVEILQKAMTMTANPKAVKAIKRLERIYNIIAYYGYEKYISFDLAMLSKYNYYTGIIFHAYTYGTGEALMKGGRYNNLLKHFGKEAAAIGFTCVMENIMNALNRQAIPISVDHNKIMLLYKEEELEKSIELAASYRKNGQDVAAFKIEEGKSAQDYLKTAQDRKFACIVYMENGIGKRIEV